MQIAPNGKMRQASRKGGRLSHFCCKLDAWGLQTFAIPSIPSLVKICDAFQITLSEFFAKAEGSESAPVVLTPQQMQVMEKWSEGWLMYFDSYTTGKRIQHLRKANGMTQEEPAVKLNTSDRHLRDLECGEEASSIDLMPVSEKPILTFTIDFETAKRYREANKMPHQFRRAAWTDLTVEVYL